MLSTSSNLALPRKVVVYYLLFSLLAVCCVVIGMIVASHSIMESRTAGACLGQIGKTASALELSYLLHGEEELQQVLNQHPLSQELISHSVVSLENTILAHSDESLVGETAAEISGEQLRWGNVSGVQYVDSHGRTINEYRVPLVAHDERFGTLRLAVGQLGFFASLEQIGKFASLVVLLPLVLVVAGGVFLARLARPVSEVESQLRATALQRRTEPLSLNSLNARDAVSIGWNRIVESMQEADQNGSKQTLSDRLADVIAERGEKHMQEVFENLPEGLAVTDVEGRVTFANRAIAALLEADTTPEELEGIELEGQLLMLGGEGQDDGLFEDEGNQHTTITEFESHQNGDSRTLRVARSPMQSETVRGHLWSVRDVTQQKLTERTRDQFIDAATHELRTPLSNIKAYAETLVTAEEIEVEQQKEFCNIINSEVTRLARFVDDLLSISSMEAGSIVIDRQRTILSRMFDEVLAKVQPLMTQKAIDFVVEVPEKMIDLQLDKDKTVAVLVNLLGNAAKYTPEGGRVAMRVKLDSSNLQVAIEDTGVGIAADEVSKVFDKFFRSSDPRIQGETGTGLGLSLAREVVRMHGGDITVDSQLDQGTTFVATFPVV